MYIQNVYHNIVTCIIETVSEYSDKTIIRVNDSIIFVKEIIKTIGRTNSRKLQLFSNGILHYFANEIKI